MSINANSERKKRKGKSLQKYEDKIENEGYKASDLEKMCRFGEVEVDSCSGDNSQF